MADIDMPVEREGLALAEEAGEVCRALVKRAEATRATPAHWTAELRKELGQTVCVALTIMAMEGWVASEVIADAAAGLVAKPATQAT